MKIVDYKTIGGKNLITDYIDKLPINLKIKVLDIRRSIENEGLIAFTGFDTKRLVGKLYEIRFSNQRIAYIIIDSDVVYFLHIFKKQKNKTEKNDINLAIERAKRKGLI